ncbi:MAG: hypothetical protein Q9198_008399 [Flavoplaca austrocitrina]
MPLRTSIVRSWLDHCKQVLTTFPSSEPAAYKGLGEAYEKLRLLTAIDSKTDDFGPIFDTLVMMIFPEDCPSEETAMRTSRLDFYLQRLRMQSLFVHVILKYLGNMSAHLPFLIPPWPIDTPDRDPWATCVCIDASLITMLQSADPIPHYRNTSPLSHPTTFLTNRNALTVPASTPNARDSAHTRLP